MGQTAVAEEPTGSAEAGAALAVRGGKPVRDGKKWPAWPVRDAREEDLLIEVARSGRWSFDGPMELEFARRFAAYQGAAYGECVANGTCSLEIAYAALGVGPGDEVIVPGLTWLATATAAVTIGAVPVFVDIDPDTYQLDPRRVEEAITRRTRVVVPVHLYGGTADVEAVVAIARRHGLGVVEDCAHAHGGRWRCADGVVRGTGTIGDAGSFSFQQSKSLTCGEGGLLLTGDRRLADEFYMRKNCGRAPRRPAENGHAREPAGPVFGGMAAPARKDGAPGSLTTVTGWNYRLGEFQAAVLLAQLERFDAQADRRDAAARFLDAELGAIPGIRPLRRDPRVVRQSFYAYLFRYDAAAHGGVPVERFRAALAAEGLSTGASYGPVWEHELWAVPAGEYRVASRDATDRVMGEALVFPHQYLLAPEDDLRDIVDIVRKVHDHAGEL